MYNFKFLVNIMSICLNKKNKDCFAEGEPPDLTYKERWPLGSMARKIQRKWI